MSQCKRREASIVLPDRRSRDSARRGAKPEPEQEPRKAVHGRRADRRKAERQQVKDCAFSRFGLEIGKMVRQNLIRRVQKGDVKYARKLTNSRTVIVLDYAHGEMAFLYSNTTKEIVSFLPADAPEIADWRNSQAAARALFRRGPEEAHK
jgi:hypothetical protein